LTWETRRHGSGETSFFLRKNGSGVVLDLETEGGFFDGELKTSKELRGVQLMFLLALGCALPVSEKKEEKIKCYSHF
jgi:hypothetical protein